MTTPSAEVHTEVIKALELLHARVERLEDFNSWFKERREKASEYFKRQVHNVKQKFKEFPIDFRLALEEIYKMDPDATPHRQNGWIRFTYRDRLFVAHVNEEEHTIRLEGPNNTSVTYRTLYNFRKGVDAIVKAEE